MAKPESPTEATAPVLSDAADLARTLTAPMDGLLALGELLQQQPLPKTAQIQVQAIMEAGRRMARLLHHVTELGGIADAGDPGPVTLRDLIDDLEAQWRMRTADRGSQVLISTNAPSDLRVMIDAAAVKQLLDTLIESALETNDGGAIELQLLVRLEAEEVVVTGRLEAPGARLSSEEAAAAQLCRAIVRRMHGDLQSVGNTGSGVLTTFDLFVARAGENALADTDAEVEDGPLPPRTHLLIVDDNATNRIVAAALCEMFGCTSETAEDGLEAVEAVKSRPFDLILMDIKMPHMDGLEATRAIRALSGSAAEVPIVALTANADADAAASYLAAGMQAVVDKPIKPDQLLSTLQWVLSGTDEASVKHASAA